MLTRIGFKHLQSVESVYAFIRKAYILVLKDSQNRIV